MDKKRLIYQQRKTSGLCARCGVVNDRAARAVCSACAETNTRNAVKRQLARKAGGRCRDCGALLPDFPGTRCRRCADIRKRWFSAKADRRRAVALCLRCDRPTKGGRLECAYHAHKTFLSIRDGIRRRGLTPAGVLRDWCRANPEKKRAQRKRSLLRDNERQREKRKANPETVRAKEREYLRTHPHIRNAKWHQRRARLARAKGNHTAKQWLDRVAYYEWRCRWCGIDLTPKTLTKDHVIPLSKGGTNFPSNLVPACLACNSSKQAQHYREFATGRSS